MVSINDDGSVTFRTYAPHAQCVELLADFVGWERGRLLMERCEGDERGWWAIRVPAPAGDHAFCYLIDGLCWMPDYAAHGVRRNDSGNLLSLITVPARGGALSLRSHAGEIVRVCVPVEESMRESWKVCACEAAVHPVAG